MHIFRSLPPFLRFTTLVGVLCLLTVLALYAWELARWPLSHFAAELDSRLPGIEASLFVLGMAFLVPASAYRVHKQRSPDARGFPFPSWQQQARITALLAALPLGALVLALVPVDPFALISLVVALVAVGVNLWTGLWMQSWPVDALPGRPASPGP